MDVCSTALHRPFEEGYQINVITFTTGLTMNKTTSLAAAAALLSLATAGCASRSEDVAASYVSPTMYGSYSCRELSAEAQRVSAAAAVASGAQDSQATKDAVATTAAVVIFWPAAFFVSGNNAQTAELARLKGQMQAIEGASVQKKCGINFQRA
jgi:hypothetical protein